MITVILPFPDPRLNPNSSKGHHWAATSNLRKKARADACILTKQATGLVAALVLNGLASVVSIPLTVTFVQPDRRQRDRDNLLAASKPALDGVADAMGINDARFNPVTVAREYGAKPGHVRIEVHISSAMNALPPVQEPKP